ncbi:leucyl aminopeptidase [Sphingomonas sp. MG17]|uniref:Probable cytosol aminopeptidase n=1 Tax=Sphingomonas tagetis TaxID=2949092 RepID=A0A9X2HGH6_9SPHN|nr:leucyl aminopeptidase [Sphingomonas tagetis]MCP3730696.1 leucyl aminopeptidase [Sphingomonas tagetis]
MHVTFAAARPADAAVLALPVEKDGIGRIPAGTLDDATLALARGAAKAGRFDGEAASIAEIFLPGGEHANRLVLVGVGSGSEADYERAGGALAARFLTSGVTSIAVDFASLGGQPSSRAVSRFAAAAAQRGWRFDQYRTKLSDKQKPTLDEIVLVSTPNGSEAAWDAQLAVTGGLELTRTLVSEPPNVIYPESFVERCRHLAELGVEITVLDRAAMEKLGMGALLGVAQGSVKEGRILAMRWNGKGAGDIDVAFVGKGVTFDTGGISIKPAAGMEDMKWDMGGAGAVAGAMKALATRKAKANVVGVCGLVENMPDGNAQRPGDVVTSMSGQTIEVINTDAEGRLVLCDAITWTQKTFAPKTIVDLATLTGAMIISLGSEHGGLFANDDGLAEELLAAGRATGDLLWRFPLGDAYNKLIDSPIADMKNVGPRGAGSITAAQFIQRFVEPGVRWAHLDIAGMVWADKPGSTYDKGATGYGVRLLDRFVRDNFEG